MSDAVGGEETSQFLPPGRARLIDSYCRWAGERALSAHVLLPESQRASLEPTLKPLKHVSPLWYTEDGVTPPPAIRRRSRVWMVNGRHLPIVDWQAARSAARRHEMEVLIFSSSSTSERQYLESVLVDDTGEVVKFKRHYCDSPGFTDLWNGEASLLVASGERAPAVLTHVLTRGWGLESVGALTRRFTVQWSSAPCVLSEFEMTSPIGEVPEFGELRQQQCEQCKLEVRPAARHTSSQPQTGSTCPAGLPAHICRGPTQARVDAKASPENWPSDPEITGNEWASNAGSIPADGSLPEIEDSAVLHSAAPIYEPGGDHLYQFLKRTIDLMAAGLGLLVLSPALLTVALLVKFTSPGPVFYGHRRQGLGGKEFRCLKFRSMRQDAESLQANLQSRNEVDGPQFKIGKDPRVTRLGPWLRRYNVDELPQLINVFLGQMSLVGPRPSPDNENQLCPAWRRTRLSVRPGITGLWQVLRLRDPGSSDFQEWIYYDVEYARHRSLWLDFQILLHTPVAMFASHRLTAFAERLERHGICTRATALRRHYEGLTNR